MDAIDEIEKKLVNYENQYILENQLLIEKINLYSEREKQYKEHINELYNKVDELNILNNNNCKKNEFNYNLLKEENEKLKEDYIILRNNFNLLKKELNNEITKNEILIDKYNKLSILYEQKEKENPLYRNYINDKKEPNYIKNYYENQNQKEKIIFYCNNTISMIIKWIENNFISIDDSNNLNNEKLSNPKDNYINIDKNDFISFDKLRDSLLQAKDIIDDNYYKIKYELKKEKERINEIEKDNIEINKFLENLYNRLYEEVFNEKYFDINENFIKEYENEDTFYFSGINYIIDNIFNLLKKVKISSFNQSLDKLIEDNIILNKEIENYKMKIVDLYKDNKILLEKNNEFQDIIGELKQKLSKEISNQNS